MKFDLKADLLGLLYNPNPAANFVSVARENNLVFFETMGSFLSWFFAI
jgi:hypothetical protein